MQKHVIVAQDCPLLIFGGPYSNLAATRAMRSKAEALGIEPDQTICTGDLVAYCAEPEETVRLMRDWGCHVIKGNCEENLAARAPDCGCGFDEGTACDLLSRGWYSYADSHISDDSRNWMAALPSSLRLTIAGHSALVIHGGVTETSRFIFASTPADAKRAELDKAGADIIIAGHCGIPFIERIGARIWFNPGVIGMPANDGAQDGWFGLIETSKDGLTFRIDRLNYDAEAAAASLREAGSAPAYAQSLTSGLWPSLDVVPPMERAAIGRSINIKPLHFNKK